MAADEEYSPSRLVLPNWQLARAVSRAAEFNLLFLVSAEHHAELTKLAGKFLLSQALLAGGEGEQSSKRFLKFAAKLQDGDFLVSVFSPGDRLALRLGEYDRGSSMLERQSNVFFILHEFNRHITAYNQVRKKKYENLFKPENAIASPKLEKFDALGEQICFLSSDHPRLTFYGGGPIGSEAQPVGLVYSRIRDSRFRKAMAVHEHFETRLGSHDEAEEKTEQYANSEGFLREYYQWSRGFRRSREKLKKELLFKAV